MPVPVPVQVQVQVQVQVPVPVQVQVQVQVLREPTSVEGPREWGPWLEGLPWEARPWAPERLGSVSCRVRPGRRAPR